MAYRCNFFKSLFLILFCLMQFAFLYAAPVPDNSQKILVITSYNPDNQSISPHLTSFIEQYTIMGGHDKQPEFVRTLLLAKPFEECA